MPLNNSAQEKFWQKFCSSHVKKLEKTWTRKLEEPEEEEAKEENHMEGKFESSALEADNDEDQEELIKNFLKNINDGKGRF